MRLTLPQSDIRPEIRSLGTFGWPVRGKIINFFGDNINGIFNNGLNIRTSTNEPVLASESGRVAFADFIKGWGRIVIIAHPEGFYTVYANLGSINTALGNTVRKGDAIAQVALSGPSAPVLYFEIRKNNQPRNPLRYLK